MDAQQFVPSPSPIPTFIEELYSIYSPQEAPPDGDCGDYGSPQPSTPYSACATPLTRDVTSPGVTSPAPPSSEGGDYRDYHLLELENSVFDRKSNNLVDFAYVTMPTGDEGAVATVETPLDSEDLAMVTATLEAEATGSKLPILKDELRYRIQKKRRQSGKEELKVEYKMAGPEQLTDLDRERKLRRKDSNRRAAAKCRIKKKQEQDLKNQEHQILVEECSQLRAQVATLEREKSALARVLKEHLAECPLESKPDVEARDVTLPDFDAIDADWQRLIGSLPNC